MTSVSWGIPGKQQSKEGTSCENCSLKCFEGYYTNLLHTGDTKGADINVIFGCESKLLEASIWSEFRMASIVVVARLSSGSVCEMSA